MTKRKQRELLSQHDVTFVTSHHHCNDTTALYLSVCRSFISTWKNVWVATFTFAVLASYTMFYVIPYNIWMVWWLVVVQCLVWWGEVSQTIQAWLLCVDTLSELLSSAVKSCPTTPDVGHVSDFSMSYHLDCTSLLSGFHEDLQFHFSLGITSLMRRFLTGYRSVRTCRPVVF